MFPTKIDYEIGVDNDSAYDNKDSENSNNCNDKGKNLKAKCLELRKGNVNKSKNSKLT